MKLKYSILSVQNCYYVDVIFRDDNSYITFRHGQNNERGYTLYDMSTPIDQNAIHGLSDLTDLTDEELFQYSTTAEYDVHLIRDIQLAVQDKFAKDKFHMYECGTWTGYLEIPDE